jgi:serine protease inhibitor
MAGLSLVSSTNGTDTKATSLSTAQQQQQKQPRGDMLSCLENAFALFFNEYDATTKKALPQLDWTRVEQLIVCGKILRTYQELADSHQELAEILVAELQDQISVAPPYIQDACRHFAAKVETIVFANASSTAHAPASAAPAEAVF